jgi:tetratricopeptide (TPR) repeat protein
MLKKALFLIFFGALCSQSFADSIPIGENVEGLWQRGLTLYDDGRYDEAIQSYEALLVQDPRRGHVLYNIGNAYFKAGKKGASLGAYLAARRLLPRNPDLKANINYLETFTEDRLTSEASKPIWLSAFFWTSSLNFKESAYLASLVFGLALMLIGLAFFLPKSRGIFLAASAASALIAIILGVGLWAHHEADHDWGAVSVPSVEVFSGKGKGAAVVFKLREGAPVMVLEEEGSWVKVQISDGKKGWVGLPSLKYYKF